MKLRRIGFVLLGGAVVSLAVYLSGPGGPTTEALATQATDKDKGNEATRQTILANVKSYMDAYNRRDVKTLLNLFSEDCDVTESDGDQVHGRKELEEELKESFADDPKAQISIGVDSLTLVAPNVAIEVGKVTFYPDGKTATAETEYQVTHVKNDARWLMSNVRSFNRKILSPYDQLRDLEWLVGDWVDEGGDSVIETSYRWNQNKTFLLQDFTVRVKGQKVLNGTQRIGWDPLSKQIKSWVFDSEGGYGESMWSSVDDSWIVKASGVRSDGKVVTATNEIRQMAKDRLRFESVDRIVGDERLPGFTTFAVRKPPVAKD
jgi:uncharacterized protein (TIGR02246 family)